MMNLEVLGNTMARADFDISELATALGSSMWPDKYEQVIHILFSKGSAEAAMCLRMADITFNRLADEQARAYEEALEYERA